MSEAVTGEVIVPGELPRSKVRWHRATAFEGYPYWYAELDGVRIAEAVYTSQTGTEDYPWDWHYTADGAVLRDTAYQKAPPFGHHSRLTDIKQMVAEQLNA